jgi:3-oxoacyl-[acyl-carrier protein] reductase
MDLGLKSKVALVAASSRGLGKAIAFGLAREGTKLVICARNKDVLEKTADEILLATNVSVFPLAMDLSEKDRIGWLIEETMDLFGRIDILVTNTGGPPPGRFEELDEEDWQKAAQGTLMSAVRLSRAVIPSMRKQKWGRIIHMVSISAKQPVEGLFLSNVIRPAVLGLAKCQSQELAEDNILVNAVCPGYFLTDRVKKLVEEKARSEKKKADRVLEEMTAQIPLGRMGDPEELANLVVFLASEKSSYMTGSMLSIDGGMLKGIL